MNITITPAQPEQFAALRAIELAAFDTLRLAGAVSGEASAASLDELGALREEGVLLTALTPEAVPVGFAAGSVEENWLHIAEVDVHPDWQRQGVGTQLIRAILDTGRARGLVGATLTTDRLAAFNARFYATLGFEIIEGSARPCHLADRITDEINSGFDPARRVAMLMRF